MTLATRLKNAEQKYFEWADSLFDGMTADELVYFAVHGFLPGVGGPEATPEHISDCRRKILDEETI